MMATAVRPQLSRSTAKPKMVTGPEGQAEDEARKAARQRLRLIDQLTEAEPVPVVP